MCVYYSSWNKVRVLFSISFECDLIVSLSASVFISMDNYTGKLKSDKSSFLSVMDKYVRLQSERNRTDVHYRVLIFILLQHNFSVDYVIIHTFIWTLGCQAISQSLGSLYPRGVLQSVGCDSVPWKWWVYSSLENTKCLGKTDCTYSVWRRWAVEVYR